MSTFDNLKARADLMGISYAKNISEAVLAERVNSALTEDAPAPVSSEGLTSDNITDLSCKRMANRLIRVAITSMDPKKSEWEGEYVAASTPFFKMRKYIPLGGEPWHVPVALLVEIHGRKVQLFQNIKLPDGNTTRKGKFINAYSIQPLEPLTQEELAQLVVNQASANGEVS